MKIHIVADRKIVPIVLAVSLSLSMLHWARAASADALIIRAGATSMVSPAADTACFATSSKSGPRLAATHEAECEFENGDMRSRMFLSSGVGVGPVDLTAKTRIVVAHFQVDTVEGAGQTSYLPISISVPVQWKAKLLNATGLPAGSVDVNMYLRLREGSDSDVEYEGDIATQVLFNGASHGGISDCISIPTSKIDAATMIVKCALGVAAKTEGAATVELHGVIKTNQVYNLEVVAQADVSSTFEVPGPAYIPEKLDMGAGGLLDLDDDLGLAWTQTAKILVGSDPAMVVEDLQNQIDKLREDLASHTHIFLTGRGAGHNNTEAETGSALLPLDESFDDLDGVAREDDLCPGTPEGVEVDASGCGIDAFCAAQERMSVCTKADWRGDEPKNPGDCRWRRGACEAK